MDKVKQQRFRRVILLILIIVVVVTAIVCITWYSSNARQQTITATQSTQQSNQSDHQASVDPHEDYTLIKEWGVRFKPTNGLADVLIFRPADAPAEVDRFELSTKALVARESNCNELGFAALIRTTEPLEIYEKSLGKIGDHYFYYQGSDAACSQDISNFAFEAEQRKAVEESVATLELADNTAYDRNDR